MSKSLYILSFFLFAYSSLAEKQNTGTFDYRIEFAEFGVGAMTLPCKVVFNNDSVFVTLSDSCFLGSTGDTIEAGIFARHKSGMMIIQHNESDIYEEEVGGCTGGPSVIDTVEKIYWMC